MVECYSYYGSADWSRESVNNLTTCAKEIFRLCGSAATHYGYCSEPLVKNGSGIGSVRNLPKKVDRIYSEGHRLRSLEFFDLPKQYVSQYTEYAVYLGRGRDYILFAADSSRINGTALEEINSLLRRNINAVWGEHFQADNDAPVIAYAMNQFRSNMAGEHLISDSTVSLYGKGIHVIEQYRM